MVEAQVVELLGSASVAMGVSASSPPSPLVSPSAGALDGMPTRWQPRALRASRQDAVASLLGVEPAPGATDRAGP
jgi:hypothetical protein